MKKVLILSYHFSPNNFVGSERIDYWAKNLGNDNLYPIIITRNWNVNQINLTDKVIDNTFKVIKGDNYEVHYLPYKQSVRDKVSKYKYLNIIQKILTLYELIFSNYFIASLPYSNLYFYSKKLIKKDKEIKSVIASGRPFKTFFIGYKLKKKFRYLNWIPDYRDEWNSHQNRTEESILFKLIHRLENKSELRWTKNADFFITVSENWKNSISKFIRKEGIVVKNGYKKLTYLKPNKFKELNLVYAGTLYPSQDLILLINTIKDLSIEFKIHFYLIGIEIIEDQLKLIKKQTKNYENTFTILKRLNKEDLLKYYENSDVLVSTRFKNVKGWFPVKLFDYLSVNRNIMLCPSDNDVISKTIKATKSGYIANNKYDCKQIIQKLIDEKRKNGKLDLQKDHDEVIYFSRRYQTQLLQKELLKRL